MAERGERHEDHDALTIAALLDGDVADVDRLDGEALIAACPDCAALRDDLLAIAAATRRQPTPSRMRSFILSPADAQRLTAAIPGEPAPVAGRQPGVMTDPRVAAAHLVHDPALVAALTDRSPAPAERAAAEALVASCGACAALHADLVALRSAMAALPTPVRPRDYSLTERHVARLRPGGWRRFVAAFGTSRDLLSRPLAAGLTTLGIVGLLVAGIPSVLSGQSASSVLSASSPGTERIGAPVAAGAVPGAAQAPTASGATYDAMSGASPSTTSLTPVKGALGSPEPAPVASSGGFGSILSDRPSPTPAVDILANGAGKGPAGSAGGQGPVAAAPEVPASAVPAGAPTLVLLSVLFLVAGLGLFAIRWSARRLGDG